MSKIPVRTFWVLVFNSKSLLGPGFENKKSVSRFLAIGAFALCSMSYGEVERAHIFQARAEPSSSFECRACQNSTRACFQPELFTNKRATIRVRAYFEPFEKLGSPSIEPGAYLLWAKISARAYEPEPRLVPSLSMAWLACVDGRRSSPGADPTNQMWLNSIVVVIFRLKNQMPVWSSVEPFKGGLGVRWLTGD